LYRALRAKSGKELPWGVLTGIRPVKLAVGLMEKKDVPVGEDLDDYVKKHLKDTYYISDEKLDLSLEIAKNEIELLKDIEYKEGYSLYIGIPFCPSTCLYCSFTSYPISKYKDMTGKTKTQVKLKAHEFIDKLIEIQDRRNKGLPDEEITVTQLAEMFMFEKMNKGKPIRESTAALYENIIKVHIIPALGDKEVTSLDYDVLQDFIDSKSSYSRQMVKDIKSILKFYMNELYLLNFYFYYHSLLHELQIRKIK